MTKFNVITISLTFALTAGSALAQSAEIPAPPQQRLIVIHNATVHTVTDGTIEAPAHIVFENGTISAIGGGAPPRIQGAEVIDASGLHVYPGLISGQTRLGLTEVGSIRDTQDYREVGDFTPEVRAAVAVNPDTDLIPVTRANGILMGLTFPQGGIVSGRCSVIRYDGWTWEEMTIDDQAGLVLDWPRTEAASRWRRVSEEEQRRRMRDNLQKIDAFFDDAATYLNAREHDSSLETDLRFEAMSDFLNGSKPIMVLADSAGQIESAVAWADERGVRIVIVGGREADEVAPLLARHEVPVIISGTHRLPSERHDHYDAVFTLPKKLYDAGVLFAIATGGEAAHERNLNHMAATAAAYGLPREQALRALTINPATIMGIDDDYGSLEEGKSATLILTTGDPLEITTDTKMAFIDGRTLDLDSRHKRLYRKYQEKYRQLGLIEGEQAAGETGGGS